MGWAHKGGLVVYAVDCAKGLLHSRLVSDRVVDVFRAQERTTEGLPPSITRADIVRDYYSVIMRCRSDYAEREGVDLDEVAHFYTMKYTPVPLRAIPVEFQRNWRYVGKKLIEHECNEALDVEVNRLIHNGSKGYRRLMRVDYDGDRGLFIYKNLERAWETDTE